MKDIILNNFSINDLNESSVKSYRRRYELFNHGQLSSMTDDIMSNTDMVDKIVKDTANDITDGEFLVEIGAAGISDVDFRIHPTVAGLLMFGQEYTIVSEFPGYFLDYREQRDPLIKYFDRFQSMSGDWSGNLFDFFFVVYNRIAKYIRIPYSTVNGFRVDDTPVHKAVREALLYCMCNTDFYYGGQVIIKKEFDYLTLEWSDPIEQSKEYTNDISIELRRLFNLICIGENNGDDNLSMLCKTWDSAGMDKPILSTNSSFHRVTLTLPFFCKDDKLKYGFPK